MPQSKRKSPNPTSYPRQRQRAISPTEPSSSAVQIQDLPLSSPARPSAYDSLTVPNPLASSNLSHPSTVSAISEATSSVHPGTVNVVGNDQFNFTTHIHVNPAEEDVPQLGSGFLRNMEKPLLHPLFDKLSHVVKASYDASTPALRRACTENTRTAILEAIVDWAFDPTKANIYWMNGMAGTGKTTITYSLSIALERLSILTATFFCSRLVDECTKVDRIFPTIAYNLARNHSPLATAILEVLKNDPDIANRTLNKQFSELLVKPIRVAAEHLAGKPIVIIIDALDECANQSHVQTLLSILFQRSSELSFLIFITSRPEQVVRVGFNRQNPDNYSKFILHDIDRNLVNADIKLYLAERLVEMVDGRSDFLESSDDWPPDDKLDILSSQANGLFIYAKTVCDYIGVYGGNISENLNAAVVSKKGSREPPSDTLDTSELDRLYRDILDRAIPSGPKAHDRLRRILSAIVNIRNPLSARGLGTLLEFDPGVIKSSLGSLHTVISVPRSPDAPVSTFHASFPDCLAEPTRSLQHYLPPSKSHEMLANSCLSLMNSSLKENICNLPGCPANDTVANETVSKHVPEGLSYACIYWASHLKETQKEEIQNVEEMHQLLEIFLRDRVLHWMECLSLLKQLRVAVESLRMIEGWVQNFDPEMSAIVTDARRFVVENFDLINDFCLETYHSALVWIPTHSIIRKHYATKRPELPKVIRGLRNAWGCCERIMLCGSAVNSVAFSSDGSHIVSGSDDDTVRVWNAATGESEGILTGHSGPVWSVAFSSDGSHIVSGSFDNTVRIWSTATGEEECILEGHLGKVTSVAFSSDGRHVASGSHDKTVRIWSAATGKSKIFEGHSDCVWSVAFTSDGTRVVSGSYDKMIRIWNVRTGKEESVIVGHSGPVWSVAFSGDGSHVASGSDDDTVRIWDSATGEEEEVLEGHSASVRSVTFSSDGNHVASGSYDNIVLIWNAVTGQEHVLEGHSSCVESVAFSRDGRYIASGSYDETIRIWNAATVEESVLEGHSGSVLSVAFSSDGNHVASGSDDDTVRVWNTATGEEESVLEGHSGPVQSVAFSRDGSHIASGSYDNTVLIWNTATGEEEWALEGHSGPVSSVAFSSDGSHVVSGSHDNTVRIWGAATGEEVHVLEGHSGWVESLAFSSDGSHVVSGSRDKTVRVWNTVTGALDYVLDGESLEAVLLSDQTKIQYRPGGRFTTSAAACDQRAFHASCFLSNDKVWIQMDPPQRSCWIPEQYRDFTYSHSCGLKTAFGFSSGNIVIVDLG